jgi:hypothetical protein
MRCGQLLAHPTTEAQYLNGLAKAKNDVTPLFYLLQAKLSLLCSAVSNAANESADVLPGELAPKQKLVSATGLPVTAKGSPPREKIVTAVSA